MPRSYPTTRRRNDRDPRWRFDTVVPVKIPTMLDLTVVVATRDRITGLTRTLNRLVDLPDRPQVVVVDNGSADGTADPAAIPGWR
jgi:hypothetical protein